MSDSSSGSAKKAQSKKQTRSARVASIASAVVIKDEDLFFLCDDHGGVPLRPGHGLGLYYHDCRFLDGYEMRLAGHPLSALVADAQRGYQVNLALTNPAYQAPDGTEVDKEEIGVEWERLLDASRTILYDRITVRNYRLEPAQVPLTFDFAAGFEDVFQVRGRPPRSAVRSTPRSGETAPFTSVTTAPTRSAAPRRSTFRRRPNARKKRRRTTSSTWRPARIS